VELLKVELNIMKKLSSSSNRDLVELLKAEFNELEEQDPEIAKELFSGVKPEIRLAGLAPEERLAGLTPEELLKLREFLNQRTNPPGDENQPKN
jgi:hypothetical protein